MMFPRLRPLLCSAVLCACGDEAEPIGAEPRLPVMGGSACPGTERTEIVPLRVDDGSSVDPSSTDAPRFIQFVDPTSGCATDQVHDADREVVLFDETLGAMVSLDGGVAVSGWTVTGADLDWSRSGVRFQVQFGTEDGERRAFFTEAGPGTICDLDVAGPDVLFISATSQMPPNPTGR